MTNYVMVGAGGTGTHLITPLVTYLRSHGQPWVLHVIDGDTVETKNLERQLFTPGDVTRNKAQAAIAPFGETDRIRAYPEYLAEDTLTRFIQDGDVVLICADNFTVRARIEQHAKTLANIAIINGGNEAYSGSVQLYVREGGKNLTPRLSYLHAEVAVARGEDRAEMTCIQAAALPGGEQTIIANATSALWMLTALWRFHTDAFRLPDGQRPGAATWTETQFDAAAGSVEHLDQRLSAFWDATT